MAVSLNSVISFNPTAVINSSRYDIRAFSPKTPVRRSIGFSQHTKVKRPRFNLLATSGENVTTEIGETSSNNVSDASYSSMDDQIQTSESSNQNAESSSTKPSSTLKRAPLTARERLRAARVLNRYTESNSKPTTKPELSSKLLDALKESDKGKRRPGLPEAPTNLFDDSKRGMPKQGWTINLPGGMDVFFIVFSFVFISTVMFATTYLVWKVGAIHFNEY